MATNKNFEVKNGLTIAGTERISSAGAFTGSLASATTATTQSATDNSTKIATTAYTDAAITALVDSSPGTLNTLNELAAALGDDASFSTTVTNSIAAKLPLAGGTMTGNIAHAGNFTLDVGGNLTLDSDGSHIVFADAGTEFGRFSNESSNLALYSLVNDKDITLKGITGGSSFSALTLDMSDAGTATFNHDVKIGDDSKFAAGGQDDLQIYHDGTNSHIKNDTGYMAIRTAVSSGYLYLHGDNVHLRGQSVNESMLTAVANGAVTLYYDNTAKLETTTNGISVKGTSSNLITTSSTANDRAGAGFTATESATDGDRRAVMYLDADNGGFSTGNSGAYFYMEKIGGGGEVNFINQDTSGYNFRTGGSHVRMNIGSTGKTSWSANGIGSVGTVPRDFAFYTEGSSNGVEVRSNDQRLVMLGAGGSGGTAVDDGYLAIASQGTTKIALNANGNNFLKGGHLFVDNGIGVATFNTMDANGHTWQSNTYNTISAGSVSIGSDSSNSTHMWWNTYDTGSKYNVSPGYGMDMYHAKSTGEFVIRMGSVNAASAGASQTLVEAFKITKDRDVSIYAGRKLYLDNASDTYIDEYSANEVGITTGGSRKFALSGGNLYHTGSINSNHSFSDERLKENINVIPNALDKVKTLQGITFTRKDDGSVGTGLIAQELEKVLPEAVYESKTMDDLENPDAEEYKAINYGNTVGLLVQAIKELEARIKELEG